MKYTQKDRWVDEFDLLLEEDGMIAVVLFGGDRMTCCDWAIVAHEGEQLVGLATLALKGESMDGDPEIVGVYIRHPWRRRGIATELVDRASQIAKEVRPEAKVHVTPVTPDGSSFCRQVARELDLELKGLGWS